MNKQFYKSKTMWAAVLLSVITEALPMAKEVIAEHPECVMYFVSFVFGVLRIKTTKALTTKKPL